MIWGIGLLYGIFTFVKRIFRRSSGETLDLVENSLDHTILNNTLKVCFSGSAIVDCKLFETSDSLECLVCTSNGAARIFFPHPLSLVHPVGLPSYCYFQNSSQIPISVFANNDRLAHISYQVKGLQPFMIRAASSHLSTSGKALFAYGLSSGTLLVAQTTSLFSGELLHSIMAQYMARLLLSEGKHTSYHHSHLS